jgi:hypothetical protein
VFSVVANRDSWVIPSARLGAGPKSARGFRKSKGFVGMLAQFHCLTSCGSEPGSSDLFFQVRGLSRGNNTNKTRRSNRSAGLSSQVLRLFQVLWTGGVRSYGTAAAPWAFNFQSGNRLRHKKLPWLTGRPAYRCWFVGEDQWQLRVQPAALLHVDRLAPLFVSAQELRILISALLDRFPGKELVVLGSDAADRKVAVLVCRRGLIEALFLPPIGFRTRITVAPLKGFSSFSTRPSMRPPFGLTSTSSNPSSCFRLTFRPGSSTSSPPSRTARG